MVLPARQLLSAANDVRPAWAVFNPIWYLRTYKEAHETCSGEPHRSLDFYLAEGAQLGHSPSPLFDEKFYLEENPDISELIKAGEYNSGFDHFCQHGHRLFSPHWLFDDELYGKLYDDMSLENLDLHGCAGRYDHYLKSGQFEYRQAHFLFDAKYYSAQVLSRGGSNAEVSTVGPFVHYLHNRGSGRAERASSIYFDPAWYLTKNFGAKLAIEQGIFKSALEHYLRNETPALFDPVPEFSEAFYRESNKDVSQAIDQGYFRCGYQHFIQFGAFELRRPHPDIDLVYYRDMNPRVATDLNIGAVRDAFSHLRMIGLPENLVYLPPDAFVHVTEQAAKKLFLTKAKNNLILFAKQKLDFSSTTPVISAVIVAFNKFELTMLTLSSLRMNFAGQIELIFIDNGSSDNTKWIARYIAGARIVRLKDNIGYLRAANIGLTFASAPVTLFLNNDVELSFGAVQSSLRHFADSPAVGAVGGKIVRAHGKLQEAGSIIWQDGTASGYMRDAQPLIPEVNFVREVDYCSGVFLMCRTDILKSLGGFDEDFSPAYYEDVDLCVRMAQAGFTTLYDPSVLIHHFEFGSAETSDASIALMKRGHKIFIQKHKKFLETKFPKISENELKARSTSKKPKVLFIEDTIPLRRLGSGFVRANDVVKAIVRAGCDVSIFPINGTSQDIIDISDDFPDHVEILYDREYTMLPKFLSERRAYYDLIWISRTHNLNRILPLCIEAGINPEKTPFILDTEAIVALRELAKATLLDRQPQIDFASLIKEEFSTVEICAHVMAVNEQEADLLRNMGISNASVLGTARELALTERRFLDRRDLLFVASIHQNDSPNLDSLYWYRDEIFPRLAQEMDDPPVLNFVGFVEAGIDLSEFDDDPHIKIHGAVDDLSKFYETARVFVAPTRFAAGTPYKIYEAASFGLPCLVTDILARQLGWRPGLDLLSASEFDAGRFASQIAVLYRTESIWTKLRTNAIKRLEAENDPEVFYSTVQKILQDVLEASKTKISAAISKRRPSRKPMPVR